MAAQVLTQHNDNGRSGANLAETHLTPDNVSVNTFGKQFECPVDGQIYAQPLYVPNVRITTGPAAGGNHNVVYVATMKNTLYAFDADTGAQLWKWPKTPGQAKRPVPFRFYNGGYQDISDDDRRDIGILSTPAIEAPIDAAGANPMSGTIYFTLYTCDIDPLKSPGKVKADGSQFHQLLYALDIGSGDPVALPAGRPNPVEIEGDVVGKGYLTKQGHGALVQHGPAGEFSIGGTPAPSTDKIAINGQGVFISDGFSQNGVDHVRFNAMQQMQRPGLLLHQGVLYICFGSHGDLRPYHGWVFAYDAQTLQRRGLVCTTPNGGEAGVWQAGEGPVLARDGSVLVGTGNGDTVLPNAPNTGNLGESFLRLGFDPISGQFGVTGFFNPFIDRELNPPQSPSRDDDDDLGAASPTLLPDGNAVGGGKDGVFYLVDPAQFTTTPGPNSPALLQSFNASFGLGSPTVLPPNDPAKATHHIHGSPVVYDSAEHGVLVYVWGENDVLRGYRYDPATRQFPGQPSRSKQESDPPTRPTARGDVYASADEAARNGMPGGILSISANGATPGTGLVWGSYPPFQNANRQVVGGALVAYDASRWDGADPSNAPRIVPVWSSLEHPDRDRVHHGAPGNANDPTQVQQFAKFCSPTVAAGRVYLPTFNRPRGALYVYGLLPAADGGYDLGFGGRTGLTLNGSAQVNAADRSISLTLPRHLFQKGSVFASQKQDVHKFKTQFEVTLRADPNAPGGQPPADGFTFVVQGQGTHALGGPGAGLGFGPNLSDPGNPGYAIQNSVAVRFGLFQNGQSASLTGVYTRGEFPSGGPSEQSTTAGGVDLRSGHRLQVKVRYDGSQLSWSITDLTTGATFTAAPVVLPLPAIAGNQAYVGFTGATGGFTVETVLHADAWQFTAGSA